MKKKQLLILVLLLALIYSCKDEEGRLNIKDTPPEKVTDITTSPGNGEVYLAWKTPSDPTFMYTKIEYTNSKGELKYQLTPKHKIKEDGITRDTIRGFGNTEEQLFSLFACTLKGSNKGAVEVKQAPDTPIFEYIIETIEVDSDLGGIVVKWNNSYPSDTYIFLEYYLKSAPNKKGSTKVTATKNTEKGSEFIQLTVKTDDETVILEGEPCIIKVVVQDKEENSSASRAFEITPKKAIKFPKKDNEGKLLWSFPGYNDSSNAGTTGYSSQEASGEGASPNGRVIAMIDDNLESFWHASWKQATDYPHWFILDLGEDKIATTLTLFRRQDDNGKKGQKGLTISTCSSVNAMGTDPTSWSWEDHGSFTFNINNDNGQGYRLISNPTTRYIKVYFGKEHKGNGSYAMLSEIDVYGVEIE